MKKIVVYGLALALLLALGGASANEAGTSSDPLITKEYADGVFTGSVTAMGQELIDDAFAPLETAVEEAEKPYEYTRGREAFLSTAAGGVTMGQGGSFILLSGTARATFPSGEVIDVSSGTPIASGAALEPLTRYFVTENTRADFAVSAGASFVLDGPYRAGEGIYKQYEHYDDVMGGEWFADVARFCHEARLFHDWDATLFRGEEAADRAEVIYALWSFAGSPAAGVQAPFTDLAEAWYVPAVNWAYEQEITNGSDAPDLFRPEELITRQQLLTMLYRWCERLGRDVSARGDLSGFPDQGLVEDWARDALRWAVASGLVYGYEDGTLRPGADVTRAETVTILLRCEPILNIG